ncbi:hypothetical protein [Streptomyces sp. 6N223]|uniref:hypothetical protein n=1 Tax=Streptomyces sp. 6N223 TaxID=3457412 RepID=UPI003FD42F93
MRTPWIRRGVAAATLALLAGGVLGCGTEESGGGDPGAPADNGGPSDGGNSGNSGNAGNAGSGPAWPRMQEVAEAWQGSDEAAAWSEGYYPVDGPVQLPDGGLRGEQDQRAYDRGGFTLSTALPDGHTRDERVRWEDGTSMPVTAMSAEAALNVVDTGAGQRPDSATLEVTGAEAGEMRLHTSRGPATVPAWHFTLDGYDTPLIVAAVEVPEPLNAPVEPVEGDPGEAQPLEGVVSVSGDGTSVTLMTGRGACDGGTAVDVYETEGSVVLAGLVTDEAGPGVMCTDQLITEPVTVELDEPVGERALLDSFDGELLLAEQ